MGWGLLRTVMHMQKVLVKTDLDTTGGLSMLPNLGTSGGCLVDLQGTCSSVPEHITMES